MVKATDCKSVIYEFESHPCLIREVLSNWLARQTVNLISSERVGSSPTTSTKVLQHNGQCIRLSLGKLRVRIPSVLHSGGCKFDSPTECNKRGWRKWQTHLTQNQDFESSNLSPRTKCVPLAQLAEAKDLKSLKSKFESWVGY